VAEAESSATDADARAAQFDAYIDQA